MSNFLPLLRDGLRACGCDGGRVLVGVSGGADSVALLRGLCVLRESSPIEPIAAHLNHNLRGEPSRQDAQWVEDLCRRLGVECIVGSVDVAAQAKGRTLEEAARQARYRFLRDSAVDFGRPNVAVAHTADDQAETILHHVLRGTGLAGLSGMPRLRGLSCGVVLIRPLLDVTRAEIEGFLSEIGQDWRDDPTNRDPSFTRSRLRKELLPWLETEFNPQVRQALLRLGRQADDAQSALETLAERLLTSALEDRTPHRCRLRCEILAGEPRHLVRECFVLLWKQQSWPRKGMGFAEFDRLADLTQSEGAATLPGRIEARNRRGVLMLEFPRDATD
ncbi:MAG: tRNA lysidine(34) synthetase TilS [Planctomycetaceae bacterium]